MPFGGFAPVPPRFIALVFQRQSGGAVLSLYRYYKKSDAGWHHSVFAKPHATLRLLLSIAISSAWVKAISE